MNCKNFKGYRCNVERDRTQVKQISSSGETGTQLCKKKCENSPDCKGFYTRIPKGYKRNTMCYLCTGEPTNPDYSFRKSSKVKDFNICQRGGLSAKAHQDRDKEIERLEEIIDSKEKLIKNLNGYIQTHQGQDDEIERLKDIIDSKENLIKDLNEYIKTRCETISPPDNGNGGSGTGNDIVLPSTGLPIAVAIWTDPTHQHKNIVSRVGFIYNNSEIVMDNAPDKIGYNKYDMGKKIRKELPPASRITKIIAQQGWGLDCINFYTQNRHGGKGARTTGPHVATQLKHSNTNSGGERYVFESDYDDPIVNIKRRMGENVSLGISQRDSTWWGGPILYVITRGGKHIYPRKLSSNVTRWCVKDEVQQ